MLGKVGAVKHVPSPSSSVLEEALKLLLTFGDSKSIKTLLEQMRDVQAHNEKVYADTQSALGELRVASKELDDARQAFNLLKVEEINALRLRSDQVTKSESALNLRLEAERASKDAAEKAIAQANRDLLAREQAAQQRETNCSTKEQELSRRETDLSQREVAFNLKREQLEAKERKLRAALE